MTPWSAQGASQQLMGPCPKSKCAHRGCSMSFFFARYVDLWLMEKPGFCIVKSHFLLLLFGKVALWNINSACRWPPGASTAHLSSSWDLERTQNDLLGAAPWASTWFNMQIGNSSKTVILQCKITLFVPWVDKGGPLGHQ